ncbi:hypothetical protein BDV95DRAFT_556863 [Massariosphaeria phaeospora]|uniref:Uncharacterized protein n=1 Tax=Massariosphaeria phaeospora TaxID=100035 RepID=A0A7C8MIB2_9PLEO|nr:hypothetical protein BDV95DRAFT_556863 [Massariosphaeria phaeospora]
MCCGCPALQSNTTYITTDRESRNRAPLKPIKPPLSTFSALHSSLNLPFRSAHHPPKYSSHHP